MHRGSKGISRRHFTPLMLIAGVLAYLFTGCGHNATWIKDEAHFQQIVLEAAQPVLVDFYKGGCPTCVLLDPVLDKLAMEYRGRAKIAKFELMKPYFAVTSEKLRDEYEVYVYPTVILFYGGIETHRWELRYNKAAYCKAIDELLAGRTTHPIPVHKTTPKE